MTPLAPVSPTAALLCGPTASGKTALAIAAALGWAVLALARCALVPDPHGHGTHVQFGLLPCLPMQRWGIPCPGCGLTTAVTHFAHAQVWQSIVAQPLGFAIALTALPHGLKAPRGRMRRMIRSTLVGSSPIRAGARCNTGQTRYGL